jgi:hypothetical protein
VSFNIHTRSLVRLCRVAALSCVAVLAGGGVASASCPSQVVSTPFAQWGDGSDYFLVPGGSFEGTADTVGWEESNASLTAGNEPFNVGGSGDSQSLVIDGGGSATSPEFCVDKSMSALRFFAQQTAGGSDLRVEALVQTPRGVHEVDVADLADGSMPSWAPTAPIAGDTSTLQDFIVVAFRFEVPADGSWQIDDVYVDPYRSG